MELVPQLERRGGGEEGGQRGGDTDAPQPTPSLSPAGAPLPLPTAFHLYGAGAPRPPVCVQDADQKQGL